jgi:hypothetical protein
MASALYHANRPVIVSGVGGMITVDPIPAMRWNAPIRLAD